MGESKNNQGGKQLNPPPTANAAPQAKPAPRGAYSWLPFTSFVFLAVNSAFSLYRSRDDPESVVFIVVAFVDLLLLFLCLRQVEAAPSDSPWRTHLKLAVWLLSSLLIFLFASRVAPLMLPAVAAVVWGMSAFTLGAGFFLLFVYRERGVPADTAVDDEEKPLKGAEGP